MIAQQAVKAHELLRKREDCVIEPQHEETVP